MNHSLKQHHHQPQQGKDEIIQGSGGKQEQQNRKEQSANEQLVQVVWARVNPLPQYIPFLSPEEPPQGGETIDLQTVESERRDSKVHFTNKETELQFLERIKSPGMLC